MRVIVLFVVLFGVGGTVALFSIFIPINGIVLSVPSPLEGGMTVDVVDAHALSAPRGLPFAWSSVLVGPSAFGPPARTGLFFSGLFFIQMAVLYFDALIWAAVLYGSLYLWRRYATKLEYYRVISIVVLVVALVTVALLWMWELLWAY